jgi:hypothetical protein
MAEKECIIWALHNYGKSRTDWATLAGLASHIPLPLWQVQLIKVKEYKYEDSDKYTAGKKY